MSEPVKKKNIFRRIGVNLLVVIAAIWLLFEDWVWVHITSVIARIARLKLVARFEQLIARLNPYVVLTFFTVPVILLLPVKLLALYLLANGKVIQGTMVFVAGKITGTAIAANLFLICKERLLTIPLFARVYNGFTGLKQRVFARLHETAFYHKLKKLKETIRTFIRNRRKTRFSLISMLKAARAKLKLGRKEKLPEAE